MTTSWIKKLEQVLEETGALPFWGFPPPFPWEAYAHSLQEVFPGKTLYFSSQKTTFRPFPELLTGFGSNPLIQAVELSSLPGKAFWIFSSTEMNKLTAQALAPDSKKGFSDERFQEGFYRYLSLEAAHRLNELSAFAQLSVSLTSSQELPQEGALCMDVTLHMGETACTGRCIVSRELQGAFGKHFLNHKPPLTALPLNEEVLLTLRVQAGSTALPEEKWRALSVGDFLLLDHAPYDPDAKKGVVSLALEGTSLFQAKFKGEGLKLLDHSYSLEENLFLDEEDLEDEELEEELSLSDDDLTAVPEEEKELPQENEPAAQDDLLTLTVELAHLQMDLDYLLKMEPGHTLDLALKPEEGVYLTLKGKRVAKAELVKIGEAIGAKILKIGH